MLKHDFPCTDPFLSKYIDSMTILHFDEAPASGFLQLPPLGFPVLQFHFGKQASFYNKPNLKDEAVLIGQLTRHIVLRPVAGSALIGVNFKPYGPYNLFGICLEVLTDAVVDLKGVFDETLIDAYIGQFRACDSDKKRVGLMLDFLNQVYPHFKQRRNCLYDAVVDSIMINNGLISLQSIYSPHIKARNLERYFSRHIGVSPKSFIQILRHKFVLSQLHCCPDFRWNDPVLDGFYYDQSHFDRDFTKFALQRPLEYLKALDSKMKLFI